MASTTSASTSLHVTVHLPPVISVSSIEEPQLEIQMNLQHSLPIFIALKQSRLWPLHLQTAIILTHISSGRQEYVSRVDAPTNVPPIPRLTQRRKDAFVSLQPGEESVVKVSFRPYDEPCDYERSSGIGVSTDIEDVFYWHAVLEGRGGV